MDTSSCGHAMARQSSGHELGELVHMETASEELTDVFLLFAIESGLLRTWAEAFPDPRTEPEIGMEVILPAHIAGRFAGLYFLRKAGYVLRSARVLGALGYSVEVIEPEQGLSVRGTSDDKLFSGDVVRKLLVKMEQQADLSRPACLLPQEPRVAVKARERARIGQSSRRWMKPRSSPSAQGRRAIGSMVQPACWGLHVTVCPPGPGQTAAHPRHDAR